MPTVRLVHLPGCHAAVHGDGAHSGRPLARYYVGVVEGEEGRPVVGNEHHGVENVLRLCVPDGRGEKGGACL